MTSMGNINNKNERNIKIAEFLSRKRGYDISTAIDSRK